VTIGRTDYVDVFQVNGKITPTTNSYALYSEVGRLPYTVTDMYVLQTKDVSYKEW